MNFKSSKVDPPNDNQDMDMSHDFDQSPRNKNELSQVQKTNICIGTLKNIPVETKFLKIPILYVYSKMNCLIHLKHSDKINEILNEDNKDD